jgi:hypothetical protein
MRWWLTLTADITLLHNPEKRWLLFERSHKRIMLILLWGFKFL